MTERAYIPTSLQDFDFFSTDNVKSKALKAKARHQAMNKKRNRQYWWSDFLEALATPYRCISFITCFAVMFQFTLIPAIIIGMFWGILDIAVDQVFSTLKRNNRKRRSEPQSIYEVDKKSFNSFIVHHIHRDEEIDWTTEILTTEEIIEVYRKDSEDLEEHEADLLLHRAKHAMGCPKVTRK